MTWKLLLTKNGSYFDFKGTGGPAIFNGSLRLVFRIRLTKASIHTALHMAPCGRHMDFGRNQNDFSYDDEDDTYKYW